MKEDFQTSVFFAGSLDNIATIKEDDTCNATAATGSADECKDDDAAAKAEDSGASTAAARTEEVSVVKLSGSRRERMLKTQMAVNLDAVIVGDDPETGNTAYLTNKETVVYNFRKKSAAVSQDQAEELAKEKAEELKDAALKEGEAAIVS